MSSNKTQYNKERQILKWPDPQKGNVYASAEHAELTVEGAHVNADKSRTTRLNLAPSGCREHVLSCALESFQVRDASTLHREGSGCEL